MAAIAKSGSALQLTACWMMMLALLAASWQSTAHASRFRTAFQQSRRLQSASGSEVIRAELMHRDHPLSPLAPPEGTTLADRWAAAVERAANRAASRGRRLEDFQTPVTHVPGEYVMTISFGTPPQKFVGLVDTGSDLVWVQCVACSGCFNFVQPDPPYDPALSSSDKNISCTNPTCTNFPSTTSCTIAQTCEINYAYGDGSTISGNLLTESITLSNTAGANPVAPGFIVGCMDNNTGRFDSYDGIVGFGRGSYSFPSQMSQIAYLSVFSYCLVPFGASTTNTSTMTFGASDPTNALDLVYTPILYGSELTFYYVNMTGISVNGVAVSNISASLFEYNTADGTGGVIFDSGTTYTTFAPQVFNAFQQTVLSSIVTYPAVDNPNYSCFNITGETAPVYPKVTFHFGSVDGTSVVDYDVASLNLFTEDYPGVSCFHVTATNDAMIIGNVAMANHYIEFDATDNLRIGWVSKDCTV